MIIMKQDKGCGVGTLDCENNMRRFARFDAICTI